MRKILTAFLFSAVAVSAFADDAEGTKTNVNLSVSGTGYITGYKSVIKDEDGEYAAFRMRPKIDYSRGDIEATLKLEYDATFGADAADEKSSENVGIGADKKSVEVAQAFAKVKISAVPGLSVLAGINEIDFPIVLGDNMPMFCLGYEKENLALSLYYMKTYEGVNNDGDDSQIYAADLSLKFGDNVIRPALFAFQCEENSNVGQYKDSTGVMPALSVSFAMGSFGIDLSGAYANGKDKVNDIKYQAYAFDVAPYFSLSETFKLTGFCSVLSGDDPDTADKNESFLYSAIDGTGSGINLWRLYIIEDGGSFTTNSDVAGSGKYDSACGYMAAGASIEASFGSFSALFTAAYIRALQTAPGVKKDMGIEFDANIGYEVTSGATLYAEGAFLKTGKFYENGGSQEIQNSSYVNFGLNYEL